MIDDRDMQRLFHPAVYLGRRSIWGPQIQKQILISSRVNDLNCMLVREDRTCAIQCTRITIIFGPASEPPKDGWLLW